MTKNRFVRRLAASSPALLNLETQELSFNNDHSGVNCLTRAALFEDWEYPVIDENLAKVLVCQRKIFPRLNFPDKQTIAFSGWLTRVNNARKVLLEKWEIDLISRRHLDLLLLIHGTSMRVPMLETR